MTLCGTAAGRALPFPEGSAAAASPCQSVRGEDGREPGESSRRSHAL